MKGTSHKHLSARSLKNQTECFSDAETVFDKARFKSVSGLKPNNFFALIIEAEECLISPSRTGLNTGSTVEILGS